MAETFCRKRPEEELEFTGERLTGTATGQVEIEHLHRYFLARDLCRGRDVLDIASGEGYGAAMLAQVANSVVGVDTSEQAVRFAARNYRKDNLSFLVGDARNIPLPDVVADVVVSFETIEHLYEQELFLSEIKRVLRPGGLLVMSSPDRDVYSSGRDTANPFHVRELTVVEFTGLLSRYFVHVTASGQRCFLGSVLLPLQGEAAGVRSFERRSEVLVEGADGPGRAVYIFALASDNPIEGATTSIYVHSLDVDGPARRIAAMQAELQVARAALAATDDRLAASVPDELVVAALRARIAQGSEEVESALSSAGVERTALLPSKVQDGNQPVPQGGYAASVQRPLSEAVSGREAGDKLSYANQRASETFSEASLASRRISTEPPTKGIGIPVHQVPRVAVISCTPKHERRSGLMEVNKPRLVRIQALYRDTSVPPPPQDIWVEIRSGDLQQGGNDPPTWGFTGDAELVAPSLLDLPARTLGNFTELAVDLFAPFFSERRDYTCEVDLCLKGAVIGKKVFRGATQRHQFIVSTQLLFENINTLTLSAKMISGGTEEPRFFVRVFCIQKERLLRTLETSSIWVFSTARSGSTWLSHDILCRNDRARPMDEPGFGKMFAPLDWDADRFYGLDMKDDHFQSGLDYESKAKIRHNRSAIPPFERSFIFAGQENQIYSSQNWHMYIGLLRETAFQHVINEWGMVGYEKVVFKMPNDSHAADVIMQAFPKSFMIFLMRDGRDVIKSRFSPFASQILAETSDPQLRLHAIAFYSHLWNFQVDIMNSAFAVHPPQGRWLVYYEDLRRQPSAQIRLLFERIGMPLSDQELEDLVGKTTLENIPADQKGPDKPRQTGQIGRYGDIFSEPEIALMEAIMGPNLRRFGYDLHTDGYRDSSAAVARVSNEPTTGSWIERNSYIHSVATVTDLPRKVEVSSEDDRTDFEMLRKTLAMLTDVKPGTHLPDDAECYDPDEIDALGRVLSRLVYGPSSIRRVLQQKFGVTITRADFYSEIPTVADLERSFAVPSLLKLDGIFPDNATMIAELDRLMKVSHEFDPPVESNQPGEYAWKGGPFSYSDAMAYYTMIRTRRPQTIIEIGSGWSTLIAQMACAKNEMGNIICIEPFPSEFLEAMPGIELVKRRAQDVETSFFKDVLRDGDMLFIDSTHAVKHDSDCLHIYLRILPAIAANITVHVHDIQLPGTLQLGQMRDHQIFWNEQYLLYAYMCGNPRTRTIYGSRYHSQNNPNMLDRFMHGRYKAGGASFWFEQRRTL